MYAIINLLTNTLMTGFAFIGIGTIINKTGKFLKIIEENNNDGFKIGFDTIMLDIIDELNKCVESLSDITNSFNKIFFVVYDIILGNKFIKKDKDGKIIIFNKSKIYSGYKNKIDELSNRVKKYQNELNKIKKKKKVICKNNDGDEEDSKSTNSSSVSSESSESSKKTSDKDSDISSDEDEDNDKKNDNEFFLET
jgi:hypothetical protein